MNKQIQQLLHVMQEKKIDYYLIPTSDFHNSEYVGDYFKVREYYSGFTGSNGTLVISQQETGLWTDGRYFIQAKKELAGSGITLFCMGEKGVPSITEYLSEHTKEGDVIGCDGRVCSKKYAERLIEACKPKNIRLSYTEDLAGELWEKRPKRSANEIMVLPKAYTGASVEKKLLAVREKMKEIGADCFFLSKLDDIMWLFNIRGNDVECNPVALSYAFVTLQETYLFLQKEAVQKDEISSYFKEHQIIIKDYDSVFVFLENFSYTGTVLLDEYEISYQAFQSIEKNAKTISSQNPTEYLKAVKTEQEIEKMKEYYLLDSAAVCKFIYWMKHTGAEDEMTAGAYLDKFRASIKDFMGLSFQTICAYRENAAMMHYEANEENNKKLEKSGMLLIDSGGQYLGATTDVTRTICLGETTEEEKKYFTLVAVGMLRLMNARFLEGCTGRNLDILARLPLWECDVDYKCGTGHGVGCFLNVHEGPHNIRWKYIEGTLEAVLKDGMLVTDEPGVYFENRFGIRTENVLLVRKGTENKDGQFLYFEPLTFVPIDLMAIVTDYMNEDDRMKLNHYHNQVYEKVSPYLTEEERMWLKEETRQI